MLTSEQSIVEFRSAKAVPDRLTKGTHRHYSGYADKMLDVYRNGVGTQRRFLHRRIESIFADEPDCPIRRIQAFCKLLDDKSLYQSDPQSKASKLRMEVFSYAADYHPLVERPDKLFEHSHRDVKAKIADKLGMGWNEIQQNLYADVMEYQKLLSFEGYPDASAFLSRYNVAQLQACLYKAQQISVTATDDFKTILRYAKLAHLMHDIIRTGPSRYRICFSGPASVLTNTRRYGVNFAKFLPALLACKNWQMEAAITTPWNTKARLILSDKDGFSSHLPCPDEFDSTVEQSFADKFGLQRHRWRLIREGGILYQRQRTFVPDFVFRHDDGTEVFLEIVGFWTPEYLAHRRQTVREFKNHNIILAVQEKSLKKDISSDMNVISYKTALRLEPVIKALESIRASTTQNIKK